MIKPQAVPTNPPRTAGRPITLAFFCLLISSAVHAQVDAVDLTPAFLAGGIEIDRLMVFKISDIVLIRGRTSDVAKAAEAARFARSLGYQRVANLIEIVPSLDDRAIERIAARAIDMAPGLAGCRFQVSSLKGIVRLQGQARQGGQKDLALALVRRIDGVRTVQFDEIKAVNVEASGSPRD